MGLTGTGSGVDVVRFCLATGIVPSLLGFESKKRSIPKEQSMPVLSTLEMLFYYFPFTQLSVWHLLYFIYIFPNSF